MTGVTCASDAVCGNQTSPCATDPRSTVVAATVALGVRSKRTRFVPAKPIAERPSGAAARRSMRPALVGRSMGPLRVKPTCAGFVPRWSRKPPGH